MIHITVGALKEADPEDGMQRSHVGYREGMSDQEMYDANHGEWAIGTKRQETERFALFSFNGTVIQAIEVHKYERTRKFEKHEKRDDKYTMHGEILTDGHPVYDKYVGQPTPVSPGRNPVRYFSDPEFDNATGRPCRCGCGETTTAGDFIPGHDQRAIHERIARIGTVAEFLDWMDVVRPATVNR
jgi:hypothetical protein